MNHWETFFFVLVLPSMNILVDQIHSTLKIIRTFCSHTLYFMHTIWVIYLKLRYICYIKIKFRFYFKYRKSIALKIIDNMQFSVMCNRVTSGGNKKLKNGGLCFLHLVFIWKSANKFYLNSYQSKVHVLFMTSHCQVFILTFSHNYFDGIAICWCHTH